MFSAWRVAARRLLAERVAPSDVLWSSQSDDEENLLAFDEPTTKQLTAPQLNVPRHFVRLAETVCCHRSGKQWAMLYEILWAMAYGNDRDILQNQTDSTVRALDRMRATVSRDIHKMRAFVRFREVKSGEGERENFIAWYEPEHLVVRLNAPFFKRRFGGMNWSILTPDECVHWDGEQIRYTEGVDKSKAPEGDELEELWRGYYRSIFNPARLKIKMMQSEMPKKYWRNLPEAEIIEELIQGSAEMVQKMMVEDNRPLKPTPKNDYLRNLEQLNEG